MPTPQPEPDAPARFRPSVHGFAFANSWPDEPAVSIPTPLGAISVGNASAGLCGGMVFAALDYWHAVLVPPVQRPAPADPLFGYVVHRLVDSWNVPAGVAEYYQWMNLPDADRAFSALGQTVVAQRGLVWRTVQVQWPAVRADLDSGIPVPLGIVTVASANPQDLGQNHQVAAWSYQLSGSTVTVLVYDPNSPGRDDVGITFDSAATGSTDGAFTHTLGIGHPVRGFFRTAYSPAQPPAT
jgi:hypothetical protein